MTGGKVVVKANGEVNTIDAITASDGLSIAIETNGNVGTVISSDDSIVSSGNVTFTNPNDVAYGFAGVGIENSPYLISNLDQLLLIDNNNDKTL